MQVDFKNQFIGLRDIYDKPILCETTKVRFSYKPQTGNYVETHQYAGRFFYNVESLSFELHIDAVNPFNGKTPYILGYNQFEFYGFVIAE